MTRSVKKRYPATAQSEGAGALVHRTVGTRFLQDVDPFLLLDEFELAEDRNSPGFPDHPHRGFETVTYLFNGIMTHRDTAGNAGTIEKGGVQWMTAGSGLIHSETPDYSEGTVHGMQLWVNLPSADKMQAPKYRDIAADDIPMVETDEVQIRVIAGDLDGTTGPMTDITVDPLYLDIFFKTPGTVRIPVTEGHTCILYAVENRAAVKARTIEPRSLAILGPEGGHVDLQGMQNCRIMLMAAKPINEPIMRYGPFVMNTQEELKTAIEDYESGRLDQVG